MAVEKDPDEEKKEMVEIEERPEQDIVSHLPVKSDVVAAFREMFDTMETYPDIVQVASISEEHDGLHGQIRCQFAALGGFYKLSSNNAQTWWRKSKI